MVLDSDTVEPFSFSVLSVLLLLMLLGGKALKIMFDVNCCSAFVGVHRDVAEGERGAAFGHRRWHVAAIKLTHRVARGLHVASIVHRVGSEIDAQVESVAVVVAQVEAVGLVQDGVVDVLVNDVLVVDGVVDVLVNDVLVVDGVVDVLVNDVLVVDEAVVGVVMVGVFVVSALNNDIVVWVAVVGDQSAAVVVTGELNRVRIYFRDRSDE